MESEKEIFKPQYINLLIAIYHPDSDIKANSATSLLAFFVDAANTLLAFVNGLNTINKFIDKIVFCTTKEPVDLKLLSKNIIEVAKKILTPSEVEKALKTK